MVVDISELKKGLVGVIGDWGGWRDSAECRGEDPNQFFPGKGWPKMNELCRRCTVREECLNFALDNFERFGIWGGASERRRREIRRERAIHKGSPQLR